jgi:hypothetical protein
MRKIAPWLNLTTGLIWIFIALRAAWWPRFPSLSHMSIAHRRSLVPIEVAAGVLWLAAGVAGLFKARRNPEGKVEPAITTIFGPQ